MNNNRNNNKCAETSEKNSEMKLAEGVAYNRDKMHGRKVEGIQGRRRRSVIVAASALACLSQPPKSASNHEKKDKDILEREIDKNPFMTFPQKLMEILAGKDNKEIVAWLPHGKAFIIFRKRKFASHILPKYFEMTKFTSFTRKLNRWGFYRVKKGAEAGAYHHKYFCQENPSLCKHMICASENKDKQHFPKKCHACENASLKEVQSISDTCSLRVTPGPPLLSNMREFFNPSTKLASSNGFNRENVGYSIRDDQQLQAKDQTGSMKAPLNKEKNIARMNQEILRMKQNMLYIKQKQQLHSTVMKNAANALQLSYQRNNIGLRQAITLPKPLSIETAAIIQHQRNHFTMLGLIDTSFVSAMTQQRDSLVSVASQNSIFPAGGMWSPRAA